MTKPIKEEVAVNNAGAGNIAGIGVGAQGEPPKSRALLKRVRNIMKRKVPNVGSAKPRT